jgi:S-DNA-T family DNA segregation ATPase FtsK/SpoIIIE
VKVKFTYHREAGSAVDLVATLDSATTIGDLAEHLCSADPERRDHALTGPVTLTLADRNSLLLDPDLPVADSALASGAHVTLAQASARYATATGAAARLRVTGGPDAGREFPLAHGSTTIGRDPQCDIVLTDRLASRRHARLNVTDVVEVIDLGSANGVTVGEATVPRATLRPGDVVGIGNTELVVQLLHSASPIGASSLGFNRSPRVEPRHEGRTFEAPEPPEKGKPQRFPLIALIAPLLMGGVLYLVTKNPSSLLFVLLSPLMLVGNAVESRLAVRRDFARAVKEYDAELVAVGQALADETAAEAVVRRGEHPLGASVLQAVKERDALLWSRRPDLPRFTELAFGLGALPSRSTIEYAHGARSTTALKERAREVLEPLTVVADVPVTAHLGDGAIGVAGPRSVSLGLVRSLVLQAVGLHSPAELVLAAVLSSETAADWDWLKWLPHTSSPHSPLPGRQLVSLNADALALLVELENLVDDRRTSHEAQSPPDLPAVLVLVESGAEVERARLVAVAEQGPAVGVFVVWMAPEVTLLPAACTTFASVDPAGGAGSVSHVHLGARIVPVVLDEVGAAEAAAAARLLAPLYDAGAVIADESDLPRSVSQFALVGTELGSEPAALIERWQQNSSILTGPYAPERLPRKAGSLRAVVGQSPVGHHALDLRTDGPHALVGGTTGAGKSELLQSWILSLAAAHSPQRVNFLLVDYKGGAAFADCVDLPHCIGLVTDLSPHMVRRALTSLRAELRYREEILAEHNAKDLQALEAQGYAGAPPSLVIVVDEFAALATDVPEFVDGMVDVAQRGRSLGLHLILATQRPAGVIKGNLRANTNLRLALRMADEEDSTDILGVPVAASFDPSIPGRAMSKSGPKRLVPFQAAYAGGWTSETAERPAVVVDELSLGAVRAWLAPSTEELVVRDRDKTDIKRLVRVVREANRAAALPAPRRAWLPVLSERQSLAAVHRRALDTELAFAVADDPAHQAQPTVAFFPDVDGNMVVYGTGGSGKSTFLRSIGIAAGLTMKGGPCLVYGLDFGSRGLSMLEDLPHVGSIIAGSDHERITRLIGWLRSEVDERALRYSQVNAGTITQYRRIVQRPDEPRIILLVDGIAAFRSAYESTDRTRWFETFTSVASEGRPVGVHVVLSSETRGGLTTALSAAVQRRLVLRMATEDDYGLLGVPSDVIGQRAAPGRGLLGEAEVQVAVLGASGDPVEQARQVAGLAKSMREAGVPAAPAIQSLPEKVFRADITGDDLVLGVASDDLQPLLLDPRGAFLLSGPPQSGRTTTLAYLAWSLRRADPARELVYFGNRRSLLAQLPCWTTTAYGADEVVLAATTLTARLAEGARVAVFLESAGDFANGPADLPLAQLVKACVADEQWFVAEGESSTVGGISGFMGTVKAARQGFVLQPDQDAGLSMFKTPFPRMQRSDFPPGRGMYVAGGKARVVQAALLSPDGG